MSNKYKHNKYNNCKWNRILTKISKVEDFKTIDNDEHYSLLNINDSLTREIKTRQLVERYQKATKKIHKKIIVPY